MSGPPFAEQAVQAVLAWRRQHGYTSPAPLDPPAAVAPVECPTLRAARHEIGHLRARVELLAKQEERERHRAEDAERERESLRRALENTAIQLAAANGQLREALLVQRRGRS